MGMEIRAAREFLGGDISGIELFHSGTANQNFLVEDGEGNRYVLRMRNPKYAEPSFAAFEAEYLAHLSSAGLPVPFLINTPAGSPFLNLDGMLWQMSRRIIGSPYSGCLEQIRQAGCFLARIHNAIANFTPVHERRCPRYERPDLLRAKYNQFLATMNPDAGHLRQLCWVPNLIDHLARILSDAVYSSLPKLHIHGDYHCWNLLFQGNNVAGLFDFDRVSLQARLRDIADGVIFFGSGRETPINAQDIVSLTQGFLPEPGLYHEFLLGYQDTVCISLKPEEKMLLPFFIVARFLGMRLDGIEKLPIKKRWCMLEDDITQPLRWFEWINDGVSAML